jgi:RimJ/RimL family protein N-acetyltransferase
VKILETDRLVLRWLKADDAAFVLQLVNDPAWLRFIGDRGVQTLEDAAKYIANGPVAMYQRLGFGLYLVELKERAEPIGICGLIKRDTLEDVDLGFAFLPRFWSQGYAFEAASATLALGARTFGLSRIVAVTSPDNDRSARLLAKLGFRFERLLQLTPGAPEVKLYGLNV